MKTKFTFILPFFLMLVFVVNQGFAQGSSYVSSKSVDSLKQKESRLWYVDKTPDELNDNQDDEPQQNGSKGKKKGENKVKERSVSISPAFGQVLGFIIKIIAWALLAVVIGYAVYLIATNLKDFKWQINKSVNVETASWQENEITHENINNVDLDPQLTAAIKQQNYALAVRLYYLKVVKELNTKQLIDFHINKTNQEYIKEMGKNNSISSQKLSLFKQCTRFYEYIWFGKFPVDEMNFRLIETEFKTFLSAS